MQDSVNPLALLFLVAMSFVILGSNRRNAVRALLATAAFVPLGQQIPVLGLHFYFLRILILVGLARLLIRGEASRFKMLPVDKLFLGWVFTCFAGGLLRGPSGETFGAVYNSIGIYFFIRVLVQDSDDIFDQLRWLAGVAVLISIPMIVEHVTDRNPFYFLGGVPELSEIREGRIRCQGPFRHAILGGTFGATLFPLMIGLWYQGGAYKRTALMGAMGSAAIAITSASSGALLTIMAALIGFGLWPMREKMRLFRRGVVVTIIGFALVMKAPVWYLIARVSDLVGGGGWHRSYLIDQFVKHFNEWFLIGTSVTAHWAPAGQVLAADPNNMDITNHYVAQGIQGGLLGLGLFLAIIASGFTVVGRGARGLVDLPFERKMTWAFGVALACHCTAFISISYFDQINVFWFWLLAVLAGLSAAPVKAPAASVGAETNCQSRVLALRYSASRPKANHRGVIERNNASAQVSIKA